MSLRIAHHPVLGSTPTDSVNFTVDDEEIEARLGETVAGAVWAAGSSALRSSRSDRPRGLYCGIGHCFECRVTIDGEPGQRSCLRLVERDMRVQTETAAGSEPDSRSCPATDSTQETDSAPETGTGTAGAEAP